MTQAIVMTRWPKGQSTEAAIHIEEERVRAEVGRIRGARLVEIGPRSALVVIDDDRAFVQREALRALSEALPDWEISEETRYSLPAT